MEKYDCSGWATKANLKCSDGRTIMKDAFKHNDGQTVPLVWNHQHNDPNEVLGHALLENREEGVYAYCSFNDTESGNTAKLLVKHGDVSALSIYANQLKQKMDTVLHGNIREVSLVLAGANPGAFIDSIISHGEESDEEAIIYTGEDITLSHADEEPSKEDEELSHAEKNEKEDEKVSEEAKKSEEVKTPEEGENAEEIFETLNDKQKDMVYALIGQALLGQESDEESETENEEKGDDETMKHNVFEQDEKTTDTLSHSDIKQVFENAKRYGSLKDAFQHSEISDEQLMHAVQDSKGNTVTYGIADIDWLFPEAKSLNTPPGFIQRRMDWVKTVMAGVHHTPFSRIKSMFANITMEEARAKGYMKGKLKKEEVFTLLKRSTSPTTIYKKQKLDRDDVNDITDFDVVAWLKSEMRMMLDEEIARAILVGDGRSTSDDDKINEQNIRPIWKDEELYTIKAPVVYAANATENDKVKAFIRAAIKARKDYKGSGNPVLFTTEDVLTDCLLLEDLNGRVIYDSVEKLATALRVSRIVTVPVLEGQSRTATEGDKNYKFDLLGLIVNLADYNVGADKGGAVSMFDDFDIDYNQQKYLIETRCSGALTVPYSAIAIEAKSEVVAG